MCLLIQIAFLFAANAQFNPTCDDICVHTFIYITIVDIIEVNKLYCMF